MADSLRITLGPPVRLDKALAAAAPDASGLSRVRVQALIAGGQVRDAAGAVLGDARAVLPEGTQVLVELPPPEPTDVAAEAIPLDVVFEDADLIVIDKPAGLVVHPAPGAPRGTLVNALLHHCGDSLSGIGGALRPGIVHRIDKDTSGLIVAAKSDAAHQGLAEQFAAHSIERRYLAVVRGAPDRADRRLNGLAGISWESGAVLRIEGNIGRHPGDRKRMCVLSHGGRRAVTRAKVLERFAKTSLLACWLETGRTHQIRVHMSFAGHALIGDAVYGPRTAPVAFARQALHAATLGFVHPLSGETLRFERAPPADFAELVAALRDGDAG